MDIKKQLAGLSIEAKNITVALWMSKTRLGLGLVTSMDEEYNRIYHKNIKNGLVQAEISANKHILDLVYGK